MATDVFEVSTVLSKPNLKYQISSIAVTRNQVFVGSEDGSLHVYDVTESATGRVALEPVTTSDGIVQRFSGSARRPVRNLIAISEWNGLVSIAGPALPPSSVPLYEGGGGSSNSLNNQSSSSTPLTRNRLGATSSSSSSSTSTSSTSCDGALFHSLDALQLGGRPIPHSRYCIAIEASPSAGLLIVVHRTRIVVLSWSSSSSSSSLSSSSSNVSRSSNDIRATSDDITSEAVASKPSYSFFGRLISPASTSTTTKTTNKQQKQQTGKSDSLSLSSSNDALFSLVAEHWITGVDASMLEKENKEKENSMLSSATRERSFSRASLLGVVSSTTTTTSSSSSSSSSSSNQMVSPTLVAASSDSPYISIVSATWVGQLLCLYVIHRRDIAVHVGSREAAALASVNDDDDRHQSGMTGITTAAAASESPHLVRLGQIDAPTLSLYDPLRVPERLDTGFELVYIFIHPWTGQVMEKVRAGPAPPLDVNGYPTMSPADVSQQSQQTTSPEVAAAVAALNSAKAAAATASATLTAAINASNNSPEDSSLTLLVDQATIAEMAALALVASTSATASKLESEAAASLSAAAVGRAMLEAVGASKLPQVVPSPSILY